MVRWLFCQEVCNNLLRLGDCLQAPAVVLGCDGTGDDVVWKSSSREQCGKLV